MATSGEVSREGLAPVATTGMDRLRARLAVAVMLSGSVMMALIFTALAPVLPQIAAHYGTANGATMAQLVMSAPGIGVIVGGLTGGLLVDRLGRRRLLPVALLVFSIVGCAPLYLESYSGLLISRAVLGWSGATIQAAVIGLIAATFREPLRAKMIGYEAAIGSAAAVASILASGLIAQTAGWRAPATLYLAALPILVLALVAIPADAPRPATVIADHDPAMRFGSFVRGLAPFFALVPIAYATNYMLSIQMPFLLAENGVSGPAATSRIMVVAVAASVIGAASSGWIRQFAGERASMAVTVSLMGTGFLVLGSSHSIPVAIGGGFVAGLGGGMLLPNLMAVATSRAGETLRSRAAGLVYTMAYVGEFLNPIAFRPLSVSIGIHHAFQAIGASLLVLMAVGTVIAWRLRSRSRETIGPRK